MLEIQFYHEAKKFLSDIFLDLQEHKIVLMPHWEIDHICFRADSNANYEILKTSFLKFAELLIESEVNGK